MTEARKKANALTDAQKMAEMYCDKVKPYFEVIREHCDKLELLVDDEIWTLTKYRELLFTRQSSLKDNNLRLSTKKPANK